MFVNGLNTVPEVLTVACDHITEALTITELKSLHSKLNEIRGFIDQANMICLSQMEIIPSYRGPKPDGRMLLAKLGLVNRESRR